MKTLTWGLGLVVLLALGAGAWVRLAPTDPAAWHIDPDTAAIPAKPNHWVMRDGGDAPAVALSLPPEAAAARLESIALATPRTMRLAGQGLWVTYVTRSALWGFPDFTTIRITPEGTGSRLTLFARSRFGDSDLGVNRTRAEAWVRALTS